MKDADLGVSHIELLSIVQRLERDLGRRAGRLVQVVRCAGRFRQGRATGKVVGVDVGIDHIVDRHAGSLSFGDKPRLVACHHVNGHRSALTDAAEEVGQGGIFRGQLLEEHRRDS
jgi:hypothetical protein